MNILHFSTDITQFALHHDYGIKIRGWNTNQRESLPVASRSIDPTGIASAVQKGGDKMENGCDIKSIDEDIWLPFWRSWSVYGLFFRNARRG